MERYGAERLPNGLVRVFDYGTKMSHLLTADGKWRGVAPVQPFKGAIEAAARRAK